MAAAPDRFSREVTNHEAANIATIMTAEIM